MSVIATAAECTPNLERVEAARAVIHQAASLEIPIPERVTELLALPVGGPHHQRQLLGSGERVHTSTTTTNRASCRKTSTEP